MELVVSGIENYLPRLSKRVPFFWWYTEGRLSMPTIRLDIPINQSPVPAAIDNFYDFLITNNPPGPNDRIAILGTLVEFDITEKSLLYNDFVVRAFADRTVRVSPVPGQAAGDFADRYSTRYAEMLRLLIEEIDTTLSANDQAQVDRHQLAIDALSKDRDDWLEQIEIQWERKMQQLGIDPSKIDTDENIRRRYYAERALFLTTKRYAQRLFGPSGWNTRIRDREILIGGIRRRAFPDDDYSQLYEMYTAIVDELVLRPRRPDLELLHHWDAFTIQDPQHFAMPAVFDIAPGLQSIVDPRTILAGAGARGYSVRTSHHETHAHDTAWNVSGSGSYMFIARGSFSVANEQHFRSSITRIREVGVNFEHLAELQVMRDRWFASTVFTDNKRVIDFLGKNPSLAQKLSLLTTGVIVGRGLSVTLNFSDVSDVHEWGASSASSSGGVNIYGVQLGGSGGYSSSYDNHVIDTTAQTVTFKDDPKVCRLVGLRVTPVDPANFIYPEYDSRPVWEVPELQHAAETAIKNGIIPNKQSIIEALQKKKGGKPPSKESRKKK